MKLWGVGICALALLLAPAAAAHRSETYTRTHAAAHRAYAYWGRLPPCGMPSVKFVPLRDYSAYVGYAPRGRCEIWLDSGTWTYRNLCVVMIHEWGHRLGYRHSSNPDSLMYRRVRRSHYRAC